MEKMSVLIAELRENCQKLQTELLESKNNFTTNPASAQTTTVGVQVVPQLRTIYQLSCRMMKC